MGSSTSDGTEFTESPYALHSWRVVCVISFLAHAAWGAILPTLPITLRDALHLPWEFVVLSYAMLPLGTVLAMPLLRRSRDPKFDCRLSLAICQLISAGLAMSIAWYAQQATLQAVDGRIVAVVALGYGMLVPLTASGLHEFARRTMPGQPKASSEWKLWGALGFVLPAWVTEFAASRLGHSSWTTFESLCTISGWAGILAVLILLVARQQESESRGPQDDPEPGSRPTLGIGLAGTVVVFAVLFRCHELWMPFFLVETLQKHHIEVPLVMRMSVIAHVFELVGLYAAGRLLTLTGIRVLLLIAAACWLTRSVLLGGVMELQLTPRQALLGLFAAQALGGLAIVWTAAPIALLVGSDVSRSRSGLGHVVGWIGFIGAIAVIVCGTLSSGFIDPQAEPWIQVIVNRLPREIEYGEFTVPLRGWSGLWLISAAWSVLLFPCVLCVRTEVKKQLWKPADPPQR